MPKERSDQVRQLLDAAKGTQGPLRQNSCRAYRTLNPGALMEEQVSQIQTSIQGQSRGAVATA